MTSPPEEITVKCPRCAQRFRDWRRASINLDLDPEFDPDYIQEATTAGCPACGLLIDLGTLVVRDGVWRWATALDKVIRDQEPPPASPETRQ